MLDGKSEYDTVGFLGQDAAEAAAEPPWTILVADEDPRIHQRIQRALGQRLLLGRPLRILNASGGRQILSLLDQNPDTAVTLLQADPASGSGGLSTAAAIRRDRRNADLRLILRCEDPGPIPPAETVLALDVSDCLRAADLTTERVIVIFNAALDAFQSHRTISRGRLGLLRLADACSQLVTPQPLRKFAREVLHQLHAVLQLNANPLPFQGSGFTATEQDGEFLIWAATGCFEGMLGQPPAAALSEPPLKHLARAESEGSSFFAGSAYYGTYCTRSGVRHLLYLDAGRPLDRLDRELVGLLYASVTQALENLYLNREIRETQEDVLTTLGGVIANRSRETGSHGHRVAQMAGLLAQKAGLSHSQVKLLRLSAPMHDIGKVGIPDAILFKPERLSPEELEKIRRHTDIGFDILKNARREVMAAAVICAQQHHERWDGCGYPRRLKGTEIHIFGRIIGLIDVFDALLHSRVYKDAWELDKVRDYIRAERGRQFDPGLVDLLLAEIDAFMEINDRFPG
jgi:HD superfamily phosphodiesterase/CheY-like chemotaxis protein